MSDELIEFLRMDLITLQDWIEDYQDRIKRSPAKTEVFTNHMDKYKRIKAELETLITQH